MDREECLRFLKERVSFHLIEHPAVFNMEETDALHIPHCEC